MSTSLEKVGETGGRVAGGVLGGIIGTAIGGPVGGWIGRTIGSKLGAAGGRILARRLEKNMNQMKDSTRRLTQEQQMREANKEAEKKTKDKEAKKDCEGCENDPCAHLRRGTGKGKYRGGAHGEMSKPKGDELDSHHMPPKALFPKSMENDLPAIQMEPEDHQATKSYGATLNSQYMKDQKKLIDQGRFMEAMQNDIDDVRRVAKMRGDPTRYDEAIKEAEAYAKCREKAGLNKPPSGTNSPAIPTPTAPPGPGETGPPTS